MNRGQRHSPRGRAKVWEGLPERTDRRTEGDSGSEDGHPRDVENTGGREAATGRAEEKK
jgi:hypothetical protein